MSLNRICRPPLRLPGAAAGQNDRDVDRRVAVAVGDAGAVHQRHVVEQRAVAVGRRLQLLQKYANIFT